jgi:thiol-disulfide isomerase/thioredoxin
MMVSVSIGPFALSMNHLMLLIALALATLVGWLTGRKRRVNPEKALFALFLLGVLAARASFVIGYWAQYRTDYLGMVDIRDGGFLPWPGVVATLFGALIWGWKRPSVRHPLGAGTGVGLAFWLIATIGLDYQSQGARLPDMVVQNAEGASVRLSDYKGKKLVVNLWATWCPPCRREMPVLQAAQIAHEDVTFLYVNQAESPSTVATFLTSQGLHSDNMLLDDTAQLSTYVGSAALPATLFYNADGSLMTAHQGELSSASLRHLLDGFSDTAPLPLSPSRSNQ